MTRIRDRSQDAKNINKRKQIFKIFTSRVSSQFERIEMKIAIINNEEISMKIKRIIRQADSISRRERERKRSRDREQKRERKQERKRKQERDRAWVIRDRDRERDEAIETMKNDNDDEMKKVLAAK